MEWWRASSQCQNVSLTKPLLQVEKWAACDQFSFRYDGYTITEDFSLIHVVCGQHNSPAWCGNNYSKITAITIYSNYCHITIQMWFIFFLFTVPSFCVDKKSQICLLAKGSTPAVGSSRMMVRDPPTNANKMDNFRFIPPDKCLASIFLNDTRLTFRSHLWYIVKIIL